MMNPALNILSIDFNFFQNVDIDTLKNCYPDSTDISTLLSQIAWASHYQTDSEQLLAVKINEQKLQDIKDAISKCKSDIPVMISRSHKDIYDYIHEGARSKRTSRIRLTNVDMHHDLFNDNYVMDCGNWAKFICEDFDVNFTWIANPISKELYGLSKPEFNAVKTDFASIQPGEIDAIFICRSDAWFPPHLDPHFDDFKNYMQSRFWNIYVDKDVEKPRKITT